MRFHRFRVLVAPDQRITLNPHHGPLVYATLAAAYGLGAQCEPAIPDGVLIEAPEQGRVVVEAEQPLAFGWSMLSVDQRDARLRCLRLIEGLRKLGAAARHTTKPLAGGFQVLEVRDVLSDQLVNDKHAFEGVAADVPPEPFEPASPLQHVQLVLTTPLRMNRPATARTAGHAFVDQDWFCAAHWLRSLLKRLRDVGLGHFCPAEPTIEGSSITDILAAPVLCNASELVWLDLPYQGTGGNKSLGGVVGSMCLPTLDPDWYPALYWGQLIGIGRNSRMGLGRYLLKQPGLCLAGCDHARVVEPLERSASLLHYALSAKAIDRGAARYDLDPGQAIHAAEQIRSGNYVPGSPHRFTMHDGEKRPRLLSVPTRLDRALQVAVLDTIGPAIDRYFETSSFAYRSGLGRHSAARRIEELSGQGYRWAVRSDIHRFFDNVDHQVLQSRLAAYLPDPPLVDLLMQWVSSAAGCGRRHAFGNSPGDGAPTRCVGLPTGAPVSPVLANLLLDRFDEQVECDGAKLVRYADDFLILHRTPEASTAVLQSAAAAAEELRLQLSTSKTNQYGPEEAFHFLGFRFERERDWRFRSLLPTSRIDALGWVDLKKPATSDRVPVPSLPGESNVERPAFQSVAILASKIGVLSGKPGSLLALDRSGATIHSMRSRQLKTLLLLGKPTIASGAWSEIIDHGIDLIMVDRSGRPECHILTRPSSSSAEVRIAQVRLLADGTSSLVAARRLIAAKLHNTAQTCRAIFDGADSVLLSDQLRGLADSALAADSHDQLMGFEGAGAAAWYGLLGARLPEEFQFARRVAPRATDAANALLNAAHTHVHRLCESASLAAGLLPELGLLHRPRSGHLALASDLQEPFRHLVDRVVWTVCGLLSSSDFETVSNAEFPIVIRPRAMRLLFEVLYRSLSMECSSRSGARGSYREHVFRQARSLRRWMLDSSQPLEAFEHIV